MIPIIKDQNNCIISGSVIIEGIEHLVQAKYIKCNTSLNARAWNTTEKKERCLKCFDKPIIKRSKHRAQLKLFNNESRKV